MREETQKVHVMVKEAGKEWEKREGEKVATVR